jgi:hypothetical protein
MPKQKTKRVTRREFLKSGAIAAGAMTIPYIIPASVMGKAGSVSPSNRATVGFIGIPCSMRCLQGCTREGQKNG